MRVIYNKILSFIEKRQFLILKIFFIFLVILFLPKIVLAGPQAWIEDTLIGAGKSLYMTGWFFLSKSLGYTNLIVSSPEITSTWKAVRNLSLTLFGLAVLSIAFMNLLKIDIQVWGITKTIPKLFLAVFAVIFSKFICISLINLGNALATSVVSLIGVNPLGNESGFNALGDIFFELDQEDVGTIAQAFMILLLGLLSFFVLGFLAIVLLFRAAFLAFMILLAPFAFALVALPWTIKFTSQWFTMFLKWVLFLPLSLLILCIGMKLAMGTVNSPSSLDPLITDDETNELAQNMEWSGEDITKTTEDGKKLKNDGVRLLRKWTMLLIAFISIPLSVYLPLKLLDAVGAYAQGAMKGETGTRLNPAKRVREGVDRRASRKKKARDARGPRWGNNAWGRFTSGYSAGDLSEKSKKLSDSISSSPLTMGQRRQLAQGMDPSRLNMNRQQSAWHKDFHKKGGTREEMLKHLIDGGGLDKATINASRQFADNNNLNIDRGAREAGLHYMARDAEFQNLDVGEHANMSAEAMSRWNGGQLANTDAHYVRQLANSNKLTTTKKQSMRDMFTREGRHDLAAEMTRHGGI